MRNKRHRDYDGEGGSRKKVTKTRAGKESNDEEDWDNEIMKDTLEDSDFEKLKKVDMGGKRIKVSGNEKEGVSDVKDGKGGKSKKKASNEKKVKGFQ